MIDALVKTVIVLGTLVLAGWLYWLTARVQLLLNHAEVIVDRDHTMPAQLPEVPAQLPQVAAHIAAVVEAAAPYQPAEPEPKTEPLPQHTAPAWEAASADEWERQQDAAYRDALAAIERLSVAAPAPPAPTPPPPSGTPARTPGSAPPGP